MDYARLISSLDWIKNGVRPRCPTVVCVQVISNAIANVVFLMDGIIADTDLSIH